MKKGKLLSLFLAGALVFQTAGIDALATAAESPAFVTEEVADESENSGSGTAEDLGEDAESEESLGDDSSIGEESNLPTEGEESLDQPATGDEELNPPTEGEESPDQPSTGDEESNPPSEGDEENPDQPSEGDEGIDPPSEEEQNPETPSEDKGEDEENNSGESLSENSVSENTISENTVSEEEGDIFDIFPGLGDSYIMSSKQMRDKRTLASHMNDVVKTNARTVDDYADKEGIYELGEVIYLADDEAEAEEIAAAFGGTLESYSYEVAVISLPEDATVAMAVAAAANPDVKLPAVWPNYYNYLHSDLPEMNAVYEPGDPDFNKQWHHDYIGTRYAWAAGYKGQGVKVAVIDTGLKKNHEDFGANIVDGYSFVGLVGTQTAPVFNDDNHTHGTHVAGIIGAANNDKGVIGIAPEATVSGFCVAQPGGALTGDILAAIKKAIDDKYDIINMSLGGAYYNDLFAQRVKEAYEAGVAVFASAGNDDTDGNNFPAAYPGAISVGAVDQNGAKASFSTYGSTVKLSFPGVGIYSTTVKGFPKNSEETYSDYDYMSGTSQACPAAAGTAAVILSANQTISKKEGKSRVDALLSAMKSSTNKCTSSGMGAGTTWLPGALKIATDMTAPDAPIIEFDESEYEKSGNNYIEEFVEVKLSAKTAVGVEIYYSTNGKNPAYKNGIVTNAELYTPDSKIKLEGAKKVTIKAVAINPITGKMSKAASKSFALTPNPNKVKLISAGNVSRIAAGKSLKLTAVVEPTYAASKKVSWSVDKAAADKGITVTNGTVKTKAGAEGSYTVTATALGSDGKPISDVKAEFVFTVIEKADIKKVAFQTKEGKPYKAPALDVKGTSLDLKEFLKVTKMDGSEGSVTDVVWSSSNSNIATVDDGVVKALAPGKATIKATANDGSGKNASCAVTVNQPIEKIIIGGPRKVAVGKTIELTAEIKPAKATNKKLTWTAEGNSLVTVSNGKVTAKSGATGTCTIKATAQDSGEVSSDPYTVTIVSGEITKITLEKTLTLFTPKAAIKDAENAPTKKTLVPEIEGKSGFDKTLITWTSSAPGIASVNEKTGEITAKTAGKATITCMATDGSKKKASCKVTVAVPMSKLAIGTTDSYGDWDSEGYYGYIAAGKKIKMSAKYSSNYGIPTDKKVTWHSSNESILKVDKNGQVTANENAKVYSSATITAVAADGSGVTSNEYEFIITPLYKDIKLELFPVVNSQGDEVYGYIVTAIDQDGAQIIPGGMNYFTVNVSGGKNPGCYKGIQEARPNANPTMYYLQPIPGKATTEKSPSYAGDFYTSDAQKMSLTVKLRDGSGLKTTESMYVVRFKNDVVRYFK